MTESFSSVRIDVDPLMDADDKPVPFRDGFVVSRQMFDYLKSHYGVKMTIQDTQADLRAKLSQLEARYQKLSEAAEMLWIVLANTSEGDWSRQTEEWQRAAMQWRDNYFAIVARPARAAQRWTITEKALDELKI